MSSPKEAKWNDVALQLATMFRLITKSERGLTMKDINYLKYRLFNGRDFGENPTITWDQFYGVSKKTTTKNSKTAVRFATVSNCKMQRKKIFKQPLFLQTTGKVFLQDFLERLNRNYPEEPTHCTFTFWQWFYGIAKMIERKPGKDNGVLDMWEEK